LRKIKYIAGQFITLNFRINGRKYARAYSFSSSGATYNEKKTGTFGDISTFSFYPAHHITMGEGGAVLINNPELAKIA
jgi:ferredoxin-NADP reductase